MSDDDGGHDGHDEGEDQYEFGNNNNDDSGYDDNGAAPYDLGDDGNGNDGNDSYDHDSKEPMNERDERLVMNHPPAAATVAAATAAAAGNNASRIDRRIQQRGTASNTASATPNNAASSAKASSSSYGRPSAAFELSEEEGGGIDMTMNDDSDDDHDDDERVTVGSGLAASEGGRRSQSRGGSGNGHQAEDDLSVELDEDDDGGNANIYAERTQADVKKAMEERDHLLTINRERQAKILMLFERDKHAKRSQTEEKLSSGSSAEQERKQYLKTLETLNVIWDRLDQKRTEAENKIDRLSAKLDQDDEKAREASEAFKVMKREFSKVAVDSRTGQPLKLKQIYAYEAAEESKDREVAEVRLRHIKLLNQLKQLEDEVKQKEELEEEGLHLIDFEQLKIENQTLNEKIEERNDELHKLRKKTTTTVQVLTHVKEKLKFVQEENEVLIDELGGLDSHVKDLRDALTKAKHVRDALRGENGTLKQKQGFIGSDLLVADFEGRKSELDSIRAQVSALKARHSRLAAVAAQAPAVSSPPKTSVGGGRPMSNGGRAPFPHFAPGAPLASTLPSRDRAARR